MKKEIWYSIQNNGDGSAYPELMESEELCVIDQDHMDEGWGEPCVGCIRLESESEIKVLNTIVTAEIVVKETEKYLKQSYLPSGWRKTNEEKLKAVKELIVKIGEKI